jgi:hypothetical protein
MGPRHLTGSRAPRPVGCDGCAVRCCRVARKRYISGRSVARLIVNATVVGDLVVVGLLEIMLVAYYGIVFVFPPFIQLISTPLHGILNFLEQAWVGCLLLNVGFPLRSSIGMILPLDPKSVAPLQFLCAEYAVYFIHRIVVPRREPSVLRS